MERSIWYDGPGIGFVEKKTAYLEQAFRWARKADPKALLFYNDYDAEGLNAKSDAIYAMVKDFKKRGVPIDGVGIQAHIFNLSMKEISSLTANMSRLTALGVQLHITEMDVALPIDVNGVLLNQADLAGKRTSTASSRRPVCNSQAAPRSRRGDSRTSTVGFQGLQKERRGERCFSIKATRRSLCLRCFARSSTTPCTEHQARNWSMTCAAVSLSSAVRLRLTGDCYFTCARLRLSSTSGGIASKSE